jgi:hypothetical protein
MVPGRESDFGASKNTLSAFARIFFSSNILRSALPRVKAWIFVAACVSSSVAPFVAFS